MSQCSQEQAVTSSKLYRLAPEERASPAGGSTLQHAATLGLGEQGHAGAYVAGANYRHTYSGGGGMASSNSLGQVAAGGP